MTDRQYGRKETGAWLRGPVDPRKDLSSLCLQWEGIAGCLTGMEVTDLRTVPLAAVPRSDIGGHMSNKVASEEVTTLVQVRDNDRGARVWMAKRGLAHDSGVWGFLV